MNENEPIYNVFEALECENPDLLMAKAQLSVKILRTIDARQISNAAVARLAGCTLQRIKQFRANDLDDFSLEELFDMLKALGQDISITVQPAAEPTAHLRVAGV